MKAVLMGWELGGGLGHLMRLRPIAKALLETGHRVVLAARHRSAQTAFADLRTAHSALAIGPAPVVKAERGVPDEPTTTHTLADVLARQGFDDPKAERWHLLLQRIKPDLVISDFSPTLNLVARGRVPLVAVGNGFSVPPDVSPLPPAMPWVEEAPEASAGNEARVLQAFERIASANRLAPIERLASLFQGDATFVCTLPELDPYRRFRTTEVHFPYNVGDVTCGPPWRERPENGVSLYLPGNHPHLATVLDVLRARGVHGSAFVPKAPPPLVGSEAFGDLQLCESAPPLGEVLPRVRLLIHHGGLGTAAAGLLAGTPQVLLPRHLEHHVTGYRLFKLGTGVNFSATATLDREAFAKVVGRLLTDPAPARRALSFARRFAAHDPSRTLGLILEKCFGLLG